MKQIIPKFSARPPSKEDKIHVMLSLVSKAKKSKTRKDYEVLEKIEMDLLDGQISYHEESVQVSDNKLSLEILIRSISEGITLGIAHYLSHP